MAEQEGESMKVAEEEYVDFGADIPDDLRGLVACLRCSLIKTFRQFDEGGCENCEFLGMKDNAERVTQCTTSYHEGCIAMIDATPYHMSDDVGVRAPWVARWNRIESFVPGMYAIKMTGQLPEDMVRRARAHPLLFARPHICNQSVILPCLLSIPPPSPPPPPFPPSTTRPD